MKLIIQIPCYNEAATITEVIAAVPRHIEGIDVVEVLVVDDGSTDRTVETARVAGADHVISHTRNQGLAKTFVTGVDACLALGADIIVNTDGDHQYPGSNIPALVRPIVEGSADIVIGDRQTRTLAHFSPMKRALQALGSWVVRVMSGTRVPDAVSGFRALSREAALQLNIVSPFSYTIEMLIQAGYKRLAVTSVPISVNATPRASRLASSTAHFISRSASTIIRITAMYRPLRTFFLLGTVFLIVGSAPILRFLYFVVQGQGQGHIQSLILGGVLVLMGFVAWMIGLVADLINFNRRLIEITLEKVRRMELDH
jgi:glycosyltransferase involved in cell wall biosynthesis